MKRIVILTIMLIVIVCAALLLIDALRAQTPAAPPPPPAKYAPTEVQSLRLKVAQQDALLAQRDVQDAQQRFQTKMVALRDEGEKVKAEQHWPKDVVFDVGTLTFVAPQPPATPAKEKP